MQQNCNNNPFIQWFTEKDRPFLLMVLALSTVLFGLMLNPYLTVVNHDSAIFCLIGQALASGKGYLLEYGPEAQPYFTFPPLLPLLIAGWLKLSGTPDLESAQWVLKGGIHLLFLASIPLFYYWLRDHFSLWHTRILTLFLAINPLIFKYSSDVLSDVPYWALSMAALFFLSHWQKSKILEKNQEIASSKGFSSHLAWGIIFIALSFWMRQVGVSLLLGFLAYLLLKKEWKTLTVSAVILLLAAGLWPGYEHYYRSTHTVTGETLNQAGVSSLLDKSPIKLEFIKHFLVQSPVAQDNAHMAKGLEDYAEIIGARVTGYSKIVTDQLLPPIRVKTEDGSKINIIYYATPFLALLFLVGVSSIFRAYPLMSLYLIIYLGVFAIYPYISPRFILPVFPFILIILYQGILSSLELLQPHFPLPFFRKVSINFLSLFVGVALLGGHLPDTLRWVNAGYKLKIAQVGPSRRPDNRAYYETLLWIKENTPTNSLIITRKPPVAYYYSDRKSLAFPFTADTEAFYSYLQEKQQRYGSVYILEDTAFGESDRYLKPVLQVYHRSFSDVFRHPVQNDAALWQMK